MVGNCYNKLFYNKLNKPKIMATVTKSKKNTLKKHLANQYKLMISNHKQSNNWPLDFDQFVSNKKVCPESWAVLSMNH